MTDIATTASIVFGHRTETLDNGDIYRVSLNLMPHPGIPGTVIVWSDIPMLWRGIVTAQWAPANSELLGWNLHPGHTFTFTYTLTPENPQ